MEAYLKEISKIKLLTRKQERDLAIKAKEGDSKARDLLIKHNLRYVIEVAKGYQRQGLSLEELVAEGNLGICKAVEKFDPSRKMKFITYAVWWIRQSILQALSDNVRIVRIPINKINEIQKERKIQEKDFQLNGDLTTFETKCDSDTYQMYSSFPLRLDGETETDQLMMEVFPNKEAIPPDQFLEQESLKIDLKSILKNLTEREADILKYYHGINEFRSFTLEEIGNILGLTRERIRQIKKKTLKTLKQTRSSENILKKYI